MFVFVLCKLVVLFELFNVVCLLWVWFGWLFYLVLFGFVFVVGYFVGVVKACCLGCLLLLISVWVLNVRFVCWFLYCGLILICDWVLFECLFCFRVLLTACCLLAFIVDYVKLDSCAVCCLLVYDLRFD